jgi:hypothetical protein
MSFHGDVHIPAPLRKIGGPPAVGEINAKNKSFRITNRLSGRGRRGPGAIRRAEVTA